MEQRGDGRHTPLRRENSCKRKIRFCNLPRGGRSLTAPLKTAKWRITAVIPHRSDHQKPKCGAERPPKADQASSPQTRSAPRIAGRCISERGCLQHRSFILCKNRTGIRRAKTQPFRVLCVCVRSAFPSALLADRGAGLARVCRSGRFGPIGPNCTTMAKLPRA